MTDFDKCMISAFYNISAEIKVSEQLKNQLKKTSRKTKRTSCGKRILTFYVLVVVIICFVPVTGYAASKAVKIMSEKLPAEYFDTEEMEDFYQELKNQGYTDEEILQLDDLKINEDGLTYGPDNLNADLILVTSDQGEAGYVYREELYPSLVAVQTPEDALEWEMKWEEKYPEGYVITVYKYDGKTAIGTFSVR